MNNVKELLEDCFSTVFAKKHFRCHANCSFLVLSSVDVYYTSSTKPSYSLFISFYCFFFLHLCFWNISLVYVFPHLGVPFIQSVWLYLSLSLLYPLTVQLSMKTKLWDFVSEKGIMKITRLYSFLVFYWQ